MCLHVCLLIWLYNMQAHEICTHHFIYSMCSQLFHTQLTVKQIWISCIQHSLHFTREEHICCTCPRDCAAFVFLLEVVFLSVFVFLLVFAFFLCICICTFITKWQTEWQSPGWPGYELLLLLRNKTSDMNINQMGAVWDWERYWPDYKIGIDVSQSD